MPLAVVGRAQDQLAFDFVSHNDTINLSLKLLLT
jgi:hypothetical protein